MVKVCPVCGLDFKGKKASICCSWKCRNENMSRSYMGRKFSPEHRANISKNHHVVSGENNPNWGGGKRYHYGYVEIWKPDHPHATADGYVKEHRLVMEAAIGRHLGIGEVVHHINRKKSDNRPENLQLFANDSLHHKAHAIPRSENKNYVFVRCGKCGLGFYKKRSRKFDNNFCSRGCYLRWRWG